MNARGGKERAELQRHFTALELPPIEHADRDAFADAFLREGIAEKSGPELQRLAFEEDLMDVLADCDGLCRLILGLTGDFDRVSEPIVFVSMRSIRNWRSNRTGTVKLLSMLSRARCAQAHVESWWPSPSRSPGPLRLPSP